MKFINLGVVLLAVLIPISTVFSSIGYFNADGSENIVEINESKLAIRLNPQYDISPFDFAANYDFLETDSASLELPNNFYLFLITDNIVDNAVDSLYSDTSVMMINPVIIGNYASDIYLTNKMICYFNNGIASQTVDSFFLANEISLTSQLGVIPHIILSNMISKLS